MSGVADLLPVALAAVDLASGLLRDRPAGAVTAKGDRDMATELIPPSSGRYARCCWTGARLRIPRRGGGRHHADRGLHLRAQRVRMHGSAAIDLTWLASGRLDATVALSNRTWDMAAGVVIAREAGAIVVDVDGTPHTTASSATITAGPALLPQVLDLVHEAVVADGRNYLDLPGG